MAGNQSQFRPGFFSTFSPANETKTWPPSEKGTPRQPSGGKTKQLRKRKPGGGSFRFDPQKNRKPPRFILVFFSSATVIVSMSRQWRRRPASNSSPAHEPIYSIGRHCGRVLNDGRRSWNTRRLEQLLLGGRDATLWGRVPNSFLSEITFQFSLFFTHVFFWGGGGFDDFPSISGRCRPLAAGKSALFHLFENRFGWKMNSFTTLIDSKNHNKTTSLY